MDLSPGVSVGVFFSKQKPFYVAVLSENWITDLVWGC